MAVGDHQAQIVRHLVRDGIGDEQQQHVVASREATQQRLRTRVDAVEVADDEHQMIASRDPARDLERP